MSRPALETKLAQADDWVRQQFRFVDDLLQAEGCHVRDLATPSRSYRRGGRVVLYCDPKLHFLGLGFPRDMREDVRASPFVLRMPASIAWLTWATEADDRSSVEQLLRRSLQLAG